MSKAECGDPGLPVAEVMGDLVAEGALDLARKQIGVGAEVPLEGVLKDHDSMRGAIAGDGQNPALSAQIPGNPA